MRLCGASFALGLATLALGCADVVVDRVPLALRFPTAPECTPAALTAGALRVTALGDFPTQNAALVELDADGRVHALSSFSAATRALSASSADPSWPAFGWSSVESLASAPSIVLRPVARSCVLGDPEAALPTGAAVVVVDEATVAFFGGLDERGTATRRVALLHVRDERVSLPSATLHDRTAFGTATLAADGATVLVAGGAASDGGEVRDVLERFSLVGAASRFGQLSTPRRDHAALRIDAGAMHGVVLVGGSDGSGTLTSLEWIDDDAPNGRALPFSLHVGRLAPLLVPLGPARFAVVGGRAMDGTPRAAVEIVDVARSASTEVSVPLGAPEWLAALPGGRVAWAAAGAVTVIALDRGEVLTTGAAPPVAQHPVAIGLPDGRVLVEGRLTDGTRTASFVDVGSGTTVAAPSTRVATALVALPDGETLELAPSGASIRRDDALSPFDAPPPRYLFASDRASLALDASSQWTIADAALAAAADGARVDVPVLRLARLAATLDAGGDVALVLTDALGAAAASVAVTEGALVVRRADGSSACTAPHASGAVLALRRDGASVSFGDETASTSCAIPDLPERVGIAVVASRGAALRSLALARLP